MAIATQTGTGTPFAKFRNIGDTLIGAIASDPSKSRRQVLNYDTKEPEFKVGGKPKLEEVMDFVVMPGSTAWQGKDESDFELIEAGTHARFAASGFKWGQIIEARRNLPRHITVDPAGNRADIAAGTPASGDVYTITLTGFSAATDNPAGAMNAGLTVADGRIVMRDADTHEKWVLAQIRAGKNTNAAKDYDISIRRCADTEKEWETKADELFLTKPWERGQKDDIDSDPSAGPFDEGTIAEEF